MQVSDYNLERAIELYFETGGADLSGRAAASDSPPPLVSRTPSPPNRDVQNPREDIGGSETPTPNIDEDEALARRLMQEDVDQSVPTAENNLDNSGVRSPIAARNDVLVHPDMDYDAYRYPSRRRGIRISNMDGNIRCIISRDFQSGDTIDME
jgi:UBX domain-containing protein 7